MTILKKKRKRHRPLKRSEPIPIQPILPIPGVISPLEIVPAALPKFEGLNGEGIRIGVVDMNNIDNMFYDRSVDNVTVITVLFYDLARTVEQFDAYVGEDGLKLFNRYIEYLDRKIAPIKLENINRVKAYAPQFYLDWLRAGILPTDRTIVPSWHWLPTVEIIRKIAPKAEIILLNYIGRIDYGSLEHYATTHKLDILSISNGYDIYSKVSYSTKVSVTDKIKGSPVLHVYSAGNYGPGPDTIAFPASVPDCLAVGAAQLLSNDGVVAIYPPSSRGPVIDSGTPIVKPNLLALLGKIPYVPQIFEMDPKYFKSNWPAGTSFAAPIVAGVAALIKQKHPYLNREELASMLTTTARPLPDSVMEQGSGLFNPLSAINATAILSPMTIIFSQIDGREGPYTSVSPSNPLNTTAPITLRNLLPQDRKITIQITTSEDRHFHKFFGGHIPLPKEELRSMESISFAIKEASIPREGYIVVRLDNPQETLVIPFVRNE